jgi:hypothetical protein
MTHFLRIHLIATLLISPAYAGILGPSELSLTNTCTHPVWAGIFYQKGTTLTPASAPCILPSDNRCTITLPPTKLFSRRCLALAEHQETLLTLSTSSSTELLTPLQAVGFLQNDDLAIAYNPIHDEYCCMPYAAWYHQRHHLTPHTTPPAPITVQPAPHHTQTSYELARSTAIHEAQNRFFGRTLSRPLRIALCASGGGFRALLATAGVLTALEKAGILDLTLCCMGLSGSTWALFPWVVSAQSAVSYTAQVCTHLANGLIHHVSEQYKDFAALITAKTIARLPVSGIDLYGISLAHTLLAPLTPNALSLTLPDVAALLKPEKHPLVLGTAVTRRATHMPYEWITFSPFATTALDCGISIPSTALCQRFENGSSTIPAMPPLLGYILGICGSSFSISIRDALERAPESLTSLLATVLPKKWHTELAHAQWSNTRLTAAHLPNFCYQYDATPASSSEWMILVDGGYHTNVPLVPLVTAASEPYDVILVIDAKQEATQRVKAARDNFIICDAAGVATPDPEELAHSSCVIAPATNDAPTSMVYFTIEADNPDAPFQPARASEYATPRLIYGKEKAERLATFMEERVHDALPRIGSLLLQHANHLDR